MGQQRQSKRWVVYAQDFESTAEFRGAVEQELVDAYPLLTRGGRGVVVAPIRMKATDEVSGEEMYVTVGVTFEEVFIPAARVREPATDEPGVEIVPADLTDLELEAHFPVVDAASVE